MALISGLDGEQHLEFDQVILAVGSTRNIDNPGLEPLTVETEKGS